jgi:hypothetical protein
MSEIPGKLSEVVRARTWQVNLQAISLTLNQFVGCPELVQGIPWTGSGNTTDQFGEFPEPVRGLSRTSSGNYPQMIQGIPNATYIITLFHNNAY